MKLIAIDFAIVLGSLMIVVIPSKAVVDYFI